jgi:hypothetical protein
VPANQADMAWFIYDLVLDQDTNLYRLHLAQTVYTEFKPALDSITTPDPGSIESFIESLQDKLDEKLDGEENPPDAPTLSVSDL